MAIFNREIIELNGPLLHIYVKLSDAASNLLLAIQYSLFRRKVIGLRNTNPFITLEYTWDIVGYNLYT